jgi:hypothetical protein
MKTFKQFISESVNISGDFNGNLYMNAQEPQAQEVGEQFVADVIYQGNTHRLTMRTQNGIPTREQLGEHLQSEYPGAIVQYIYSVNTPDNPYKVTNTQRYHPAKLDWI